MQWGNFERAIWVDNGDDRSEGRISQKM
jgi:hypothetical protein